MHQVGMFLFLSGSDPGSFQEFLLCSQIVHVVLVFPFDLILLQSACCLCHSRAALTLPQSK